jgi:thymidine kinase
MGRITVLIGCMFAQKTTELLRRIRRYKSIGYRVLIVNYKGDTRYGSECIASHDNDTEVAVTTTYLKDIDSLVSNYDVIAIDEGQFFVDLHEYVTRWADTVPVHIVVAGLSGTSAREPFGDMLRLIPHAEEVDYLTALCAVCRDGTPAMYSKRLVSTTDTVVIGGAESFMPVCRQHYSCSM